MHLENRHSCLPFGKLVFGRTTIQYLDIASAERCLDFFLFASKLALVKYIV